MQTGESWNKVMHAKTKGAYNMHNATKKCKQLDYFVMWSSLVASAGNEGTPQSVTAFPFLRVRTAD